MKKSLQIVFFGNEHLATGVESQPLLFQSLLESDHKILALVIHSSEKTSRNSKKEPIIELAEAHNIPVFNPAKTIDSLEELQALGADCGVLAAYGKMVPQEVIDIFPHGIINLHPSLLPRLRGSTPIESAILEGLTETGVSVMKLVKQMDAGPVYAQESVQIPTGISKQDLATRLHRLGQKKLLSVLDNLQVSEQHLQYQEESEATFCNLLSKSDGFITWNEPVSLIERKIRAYTGWPKAYCELGGSRYVIHSAETTNEQLASTPGTVIIEDRKLAIQTTDGVVYITSIQPEGKKEMPIQAFLAGYRDKIS